MKFIPTKTLLTCACTLAATALAVSNAQAVVVTVTSGVNIGEVLFDANGFELDTVGIAPVDANATGTYNFNQTTAVYTTTGAATQGGAAPTNFGAPTGAYSGDNYLTATREASGAIRAAIFTRTVDASAESFRIDWADWGYGEFTAYSVGEVGADSTSAASENVLNAWGVHSNGGGPNGTRLYNFANPADDGGGTLGDTNTATSGYYLGQWNVMSYEWDHENQMATLTANGVAHTFGQHDLSDPSTTTDAIGQFFFRPNTGADESTVYLDAVPEPGSMALFACGALMMVRRRRK